VIDASVDDPDLLSNRENVAFLKALRLRQLEFAAAQELPSPELWIEARDLYRQATEESDPTALRKLGRILEQGGGAHDAVEAALDKSVELAKEEREHRRVESRRERDLSTMMSQAQADAFFRTFKLILLDEEPDVQRRIGTKLIRALGMEAGPRAIGA
jgi:TPR repeat protein